MQGLVPGAGYSTVYIGYGDRVWIICFEGEGEGEGEGEREGEREGEDEKARSPASPTAPRNSALLATPALVAAEAVEEAAAAAACFASQCSTEMRCAAAAMSRSAARHCAASATGAASDSLLWCGGPGLPCRIIIRTIAEGVLAIKCSVPLHYLCTPGKVTSLIVIMLSAVAGAAGKGVLRAVLTTKRNKDPC